MADGPRGAAVRARIRTLKPEIWQDEKIGDLSMPARLLYVGLITMADDEGRLRELPSAILGHVFPYDNVNVRKLECWLEEIRGLRLVIRYVVAGKRYIAFPNWGRHQKVDKPNDSELPPPPSDFDDSSTNGSSTDRGVIAESIGDQSRPHARAGVVVRSDPDPIPEDFPDELRPHLEATMRILGELAARHGAKAVNRTSLASTIVARPRKPLVRAAYDCAAYWDGRAQRLKNVVAAYRNWLDKTDDLAGIELLPGESNVVALHQQPEAVQRANRWKRTPQEAS